mgnify:FL=1
MFDINKIPYIDQIPGIHGAFCNESVSKKVRTLQERERSENKVLESIEEAVERCGLQNGMTISFHHHFRNGDYIVNMVLRVLSDMGFKDLTLAASSLTDVHEPVIEHIKSGLIHRIETSGLRGRLADAISHGLMDVPVVFRSHGGRAYAIETGELKIDVAFLGAPSCDCYGNANGYSRDNDKGISCGAMGYAKVDAEYANKVIILTDNIVPFPNTPFGIPQSQVDYVVKVDAVGDPKGIMSGATRYTTNPKELLIAEMAANVIEASGRFKEGFSLQMGSGGASLATLRFLREKMIKKDIRASFALGGITGSIVKVFEEGRIAKLLDVQSFDLEAAESVKNNRFHQQISASYYASPGNEGTAVNQLDVVVLSALEVDLDFNVNVLTGSDGVIRGAIGGHCDTAQGASISIIVAPLTRGRIPTIVDHVNTIVTPGRTIDILVTEQGIAVNPRKPIVTQRLKDAGLPVFTIEELKERAEKLVGIPNNIQYKEKIVGIVTYRDGSVIDVIREVDDNWEKQEDLG